MYNNRDDDERSKSCGVYFLLTIITVLSLVSNGLADDDNNRWNKIIKVTNISESEFDQTGVDDGGPLNDGKIGLFLFTQYCGPGERVWKSNSGSGPAKFPSAATYAEIDVCCKQHDECPNYISSDSDYAKYPGLSRKPQIFSRLECACDGRFFQCLNQLNIQYASTVGFGYGVVQSQCFELNYPIVGCNKYSNDLLPPRRCLEYRVDNTKDKNWQWFDVPPASAKLYDFPRTTTT